MCVPLHTPIPEPVTRKEVHTNIGPIPPHFRNTLFPTMAMVKNLIIRDKSETKHETKMFLMVVDLYRHGAY